MSSKNIIQNLQLCIIFKIVLLLNQNFIFFHQSFFMNHEIMYITFLDELAPHTSIIKLVFWQSSQGVTNIHFQILNNKGLWLNLCYKEFSMFQFETPQFLAFGMLEKIHLGIECHVLPTMLKDFHNL